MPKIKLTKDRERGGKNRLARIVKTKWIEFVYTGSLENVPGSGVRVGFAQSVVLSGDCRGAGSFGRVTGLLE